MAKVFLVLCASALFVQAISCACISNGLGNAGISNTGYSSCGNGLGNTGISNVGYSVCGNSFGYGNGYGNGFGNGYGNAGNNAGYGLGAATSGGGLIVSSASPIAPSGLTVISENELGGPLSVSGAMPFLTAVALEGELASGGSAGVQYSCGNGNIGIVSENVYGAGQGYGSGLGYGAGLGNGAGFGYGAGLGNVAGFGNGAGLGIGSGLGCGVGLGYGASSGSCGCSNF